MDKITLPASDLPINATTLAFLQNSYALLEKLGVIGGSNYILSGCEITGSSAASGYMVLNGILMPFDGGTIQDTVRILKTINNITVGLGFREETTYKAVFGTSVNPDENFEWLGLDDKRLINNINLKMLINAINSRLPLNEKVIEIGDWDMDNTINLDIPHGITDHEKIRNVDILIRSNAPTVEIYPLVWGNTDTGYWFIDSTNIKMTRITGSFFDSADFAGTSYNRGWLRIKYEV